MIFSKQNIERVDDEIQHHQQHKNRIKALYIIQKLPYHEMKETKRLSKEEAKYID